MRRQCIMAFIYRITDCQPVYLLLKRSTERGGYWQPVTGSVEGIESNLAAARREVAEETGVQQLKRLFDLEYVFAINLFGEEVDVHVFGAETAGEPDVKLSHEHTAYDWLPFAEAHETLFWQDNRLALDLLHQQLIQS